MAINLYQYYGNTCFGVLHSGIKSNFQNHPNSHAKSIFFFKVCFKFFPLSLIYFSILHFQLKFKIPFSKQFTKPFTPTWLFKTKLSKQHTFYQQLLCVFFFHFLSCALLKRLSFTTKYIKSKY